MDDIARELETTYKALHDCEHEIEKLSLRNSMLMCLADKGCIDIEVGMICLEHREIVGPDIINGIDALLSDKPYLFKKS